MPGRATVAVAVQRLEQALLNKRSLHVAPIAAGEAVQINFVRPVLVVAHFQRRLAVVMTWARANAIAKQCPITAKRVGNFFCVHCSKQNGPEHLRSEPDSPLEWNGVI